MPHPVPALLLLPFGLLLLAIALAPILLRHHWEKYYHHLAVILGLAALLPYAWLFRDGTRLLHTGGEYLGFIALLGSLFIVAGGIHLRLAGTAGPGRNCLFLLGGALLANLIGTTGASMVLIRPWLRQNRERLAGYHTVFFIFLISNIGGCLTPIGDPPLFLGYLKGVPFWWVFQQCWPAWLIGVGTLLAAFYLCDRAHPRPAPAADPPLESSPTQLTGGHNLAFLALILGAVFLPGPPGARELLMAAAAAGSWLTTPKSVHRANDFTLAPIKEVAWLFLGIFATMLPALDFLEIHAARLGPRSPLQMYWLTGALSGFLDNAPTYLAALASAFGASGLNLENPDHVQHFAVAQGATLKAISLSAVYFGALTYIGNGPNLMVKSIAEAAGARPPNFLRYLTRYSLPILLPLCALLGLLLLFAPGH